ncbi:MAG: hypothetical protein Kow0098_04490 [Ignavibacteriaceae bacterium]
MKAWRRYLQYKKNRSELILTLILLIATLILLSGFLIFTENRDGTRLADPLLSLFDPYDLTWLIFILIYASILIAVFSLINHPARLVFTIQLYILMALIRMIAMYLMPLEPPEKMIILKDPLIENIGTGIILTKDLFFSGHTATLFILFLTATNRYLKTFFLLLTVIVAVSVLIQHVHYTIDVVAAIFFTLSCYHLLISVKKKIKLSEFDR